MKILHCVESYFPDVGGMQEVVKQLSERLVKLGHEVSVATRKLEDRKHTTINGVQIHEFDVRGNEVEGYHGEHEAYERFLLESKFDIVTFFAAQQWATDIALPILNSIHGKKVSVPTGYSGFFRPEYAHYFEKMKSRIHGYDMNVYLSFDYRDIQFAKDQGITKFVVIPNGAGEDEFLSEMNLDIKKELNIPKDHFLVLHVGSYTGVKGQQEAVEIFMRSNIQHGTLLMIGNRSENYRVRYSKRPLMFLLNLKNKLFGDKKVVFKALPRQLTVAAYRQSDVFLFPSNIECSPIVLFECAAAGLPFLSNDVGNAVEISKWTGGGEIIKTTFDERRFSHANIHDAVKKLNALYVDQSRRTEMASISFANWKKKYSWEVIAREYESLYQSLNTQP
jgi:glycosyltransferase involved in cell wall biosynthesis